VHAARLLLETRGLERIEVVAAAQIDDGLAAVLQLLQVAHQIVRCGERDVRAVTQFGRTLRALHAFDDFLRPETTASDA
jgi:hypothetical protein